MSETATPQAAKDPFVELRVMQAVAEQLKLLLPDNEAIRRVLTWAAAAFDAKPNLTPAATEMAHIPTGGVRVGGTAAVTANPPPASPPAGKPTFDTLADFYAAASPAREVDKALVVGYWVQVVEGHGEFDAFTINKELRHLGYAVANITSAFDHLINRRPQLVIQTRKSGTSRQARKLYKVTMEGQRAVERMLSGIQE